MSKIIGIKESNFTAEATGEAVEGFNVYFSEPIPSKYGEGVRAFREYLTAAKLGNYLPSVGDEVMVLYNKYGKPAGLVPQVG